VDRKENQKRLSELFQRNTLLAEFEELINTLKEENWFEYNKLDAELNGKSE
jgi:hypothetical protein